jgi:hypothetical protein
MDPINYLGAMGGLQGIANPGGALIGGLQAGEDRLAQQEVMALQRRMAEQKLADQQRAAQREAEYQGMVQQFIRNPSAQSAADMQILFPDKREAIKSAWDTQGEEQAKANLQQLGGVFSALSGDRPDLATKSLKDRIAAEKEAGRPTGDYEALLSMIEKDPKQALGFAGFLLSSVVGPEKYASVLEQVRLSQKGRGEDFTLGPGQIRFDAEGNVIASSPHRPTIIRGPDGSVIEYTSGGGDPASGGSASGALRTNPGAIKDGPFARSQPGYTGSSGGFATFETEAQGKAAQMRLLSQNYIGKGFNTPRKIVERYAPRGPENSDASVNNYAAYVAGKLGIGLDDPVPPNAVPKLAQAMREFETGNRSGTSGGGSRVIAEGEPKYEYRVNNGKLQRRRIN